MINFYPGPSKIHERYPEIAYDLLRSGLTSYNHRSTSFEKGYQHSVYTLKQKLNVPKDYEVVFLSSATECWESICQTFNTLDTVFYYNGAFGKKWSEQGNHNLTKPVSIQFDKNDSIGNHFIPNSTDLVCYIQNETSNGSQVKRDEQQKIRTHFSNSLIAVDATSSLGAEHIDYPSVDIVYASVQKCLGMPAGLAVMILSPQAISTLDQRKKNSYYNDLSNIWENHKKNQTTHTPNILGILGIGKLFETLPNLTTFTNKMLERVSLFQSVIEDSQVFDFLIKNENLRSNTVFCLTHKTPASVIDEAYKNGLIIGKGYGEWKNKTIRIANFPAHTDQDFQTLITFIKQCK